MSGRNTERIPRRPPPEFAEVDDAMMGGIFSFGIVRVALEDVNQYGPHAMIMLLFAFATATALVLLIGETLL